MSTVRVFKRIERPDDELVELPVPSGMVAKLDALAQVLTDRLGFDVTIANAIGWLLKESENIPYAQALPVPPPPRMPFLWNGVGADAMRMMDPDVRDKMLARAGVFMRGGLKINAIKSVREYTHLGLKEAKDFVEAYDWGFAK